MSTTPLTAPARTGDPLRRLLALDAVVTLNVSGRGR